MTICLSSDVGFQIEPALSSALSGLGLRRREIPHSNYIKTVFPVRSWLSCIVAVLKVYPAARKQRDFV